MDAVYFQLKRFLRITRAQNQDDMLHINFGCFPDSGFEVKCEPAVLSLMFGLSQPITKSDLYVLLSSKDKDISWKDMDDALNLLKKKEMIQEASFNQLIVNRYNRHLIYYSMFSNDPWLCQERLKNSTVVLVGMGGIGSWITFCLAGSGIGTLVGVDHDEVELTNLTRQILYEEKDVGKRKVECAADRISNYNSEIRFIPILKKINFMEDVRQIIRGANLVLLSADTPDSIHVWVNEACVLERVAWSVTGYVEMHGICGPLIVPGETGCLQCEAKNDEPLKNLSGEQLNLIQKINFRYQAPSFGPLNCFLSGLQALEAVKYLTGYEVPQTKGMRFIINSRNMEIIREPIKRNPSCSLCGGL